MDIIMIIEIYCFVWKRCYTLFCVSRAFAHNMHERRQQIFVGHTGICAVHLKLYSLALNINLTVDLFQEESKL